MTFANVNVDLLLKKIFFSLRFFLIFLIYFWWYQKVPDALHLTNLLGYIQSPHPTCTGNYRTNSVGVVLLWIGLRTCFLNKLHPILIVAECKWVLWREKTSYINCQTKFWLWEIYSANIFAKTQLDFFFFREEGVGEEGNIASLVNSSVWAHSLESRTDLFKL